MLSVVLTIILSITLQELSEIDSQVRNQLNDLIGQ